MTHSYYSNLEILRDIFVERYHFSWVSKEDGKFVFVMICWEACFTEDGFLAWNRVKLDESKLRTIWMLKLLFGFSKNINFLLYKEFWYWTRRVVCIPVLFQSLFLQSKSVPDIDDVNDASEFSGTMMNAVNRLFLKCCNYFYCMFSVTKPGLGEAYVQKHCSAKEPQTILMIDENVT